VSFLAREDLVDAIEVLRAARVPRPADGGVEAMVFVGGNRVAVAALYLDAWIGFTRPECGRAVIARPSAGMVTRCVGGAGRGPVGAPPDDGRDGSARGL